jgi:hypothetical protein
MTIQSKAILRQLDNGLILRRSTAADADSLAAFNAAIHSDYGPGEPDERIGAWTRDLLARPHPTFHPDDCTLVVDPVSGKIVSSMNLISQTWTYEGIPFAVGRPELVGTAPEYRDRGLVRLQFDEVHRWSAERGQLVQAITGIPYYYRLFGYEMGMELGGGRVGFESHLPQLKEGESEPFRLRPAVEADIPFLMEVMAFAALRRLVDCRRDEAIWRYELAGQDPQNVNRLEHRIIERPDGEPVGYLTHPWYDWDFGLVANTYELKPGVSWLEVTPSVARYLWRTGGEYAGIGAHPIQRTVYGFWCGSEHPVYEVFRDRLPRIRDPYAWYLRVPDLPAFLRTLAPALEKRLAGSLLVGYRGEVKISFYRSGLRLAFEAGRLTAVEPWRPRPGDGGEAAFPDLSFLQLLFGYRTYEQLEQSYADCTYKDDETRVLLNTLFPKKPSSFIPLS